MCFVDGARSHQSRCTGRPFTLSVYLLTGSSLSAVVTWICLSILGINQSYSTYRSTSESILYHKIRMRGMHEQVSPD
jgi:hypothetical protein